MPRVQRRHQQRRNYSLDQVWYHLTIGFGIAGDPHLEPEEIPEVWSQFAEELMSEWSDDPANSGRRPFYWWVLQIGEQPPKTAAEEVKRLKALNELRPAELAILQQRADEEAVRSRAAIDEEEIERFGSSVP